jgi:hypothetical protein
MQYFKHKHVNKNCRIKLNTRRRVCTQFIQTWAGVGKFSLIRYTQTAYNVRGENGTCLCAPYWTQSVGRSVGRRRRRKRSMLASNAPGTRPGGGRTSSPTIRCPPFTLLGDAKRLSSTLIPLFSSSKRGWKGARGRSLNNFIYDTGYRTCPGGRFMESTLC